MIEPLRRDRAVNHDLRVSEMFHLLTTKEAAQLLGVSKAFLERDRWAGAKIKYVKVGSRAVRYHPEVLKEYIASRTWMAPAEGAKND